MRRGISERAVRHQLAVFVSLSLRSTTSSVKSSGQIRCEQLATSVLKCGITLGSGFINPHTFCPIFSQTACSASEFNTTASSTFDILSGDTSFNLNSPQLKNSTATTHSNREAITYVCLRRNYSYLQYGCFFETGTIFIQNFKCVVGD